MLKLIQIAGGALLGLVLVSCNATSSGDNSLTEAAALHAEALKIGDKVAPMVEELVQRRNSLSVQGRALSREEQRFIERVYALEERFSSWQDNRMAMPDSSTSEEADASQKPPAEWLRIQKSYRDEIVAIQSEANKLTTEN